MGAQYIYIYIYIYMYSSHIFVYVSIYPHSSVPARRHRIIETPALISGRFLDDEKQRWLGFEKAQKLFLDADRYILPSVSAKRARKRKRTGAREGAFIHTHTYRTATRP